MKKISTLLFVLAVLLLASCKGELSPQKVGEFEFKGKGIFGDIPYLFAHNAQLYKDGTPESDYAECEKLLEQRDTFEVDCEIQNGETTGKGKIKFRKDGTNYISANGAYVRYDARPTKEVFSAFEKGKRIHVVGLDEEGVIVTDRTPYNTYTLGGAFSEFSGSHSERNYKRYLKELYNFDRIVKIVVTDDDGHTALLEKSTEVKMKNLTADLKAAGKGDLAAFDLKGNVKGAKVPGMSGDMKLEFDQEGKLTAVNGGNVADIFQDLQRDKEGRLSGYTLGDYDMVVAYQFVYGSNGFVDKIIESDSGDVTKTLTRNDAGFVTSEHAKGEYTEMGADEPEKIDYTVDYKYVLIDDHGNWLVRKVKSSQDDEPYYESRTIYYYPDEE